MEAELDCTKNELSLISGQYNKTNKENIELKVNYLSN